MILVPFCGAGGSSVGIHDALPRSEILGLDNDPDACATHEAAGFKTLCADIIGLDPDDYCNQVSGLWASPPCTDFSRAGKRQGVDGSTGKLIFVAMEWARVLIPPWIVFEQVPDVLPYWREFALELDQNGYKTWSGILNAANYGVVAACPFHERTDSWGDSDSRIGAAGFAANVSQFARKRMSVGGLATTWQDEEQINLATNVAVRLARVIRAGVAGAATCDERARSLLRLVQGETPIPRGREADAWTSEAISACSATGLDRGTCESIGSSLSAFWDDLYDQRKLSTTSTEIPVTTIRQISKSIAAMLITGLGTGPASRTAGCGLCVDWATPQTRERAFLLASRTRVNLLPPEPTHAEHPHPRLDGTEELPWVSMAEALGWGENDELEYQRGSGLTERHGDRPGRLGSQPAFTITSTGGAGDVAFRTAECASDVAWKATSPALRTLRNFTPAPPPPTITAAMDNGDAKWVLNTRRDQREDGSTQTRSLVNPAPTVSTMAGSQWVYERPRTTVTTDARVFGPHSGSAGENQSEHAIKVTLEELAALQGFPPGFPFKGTKSSRARQVGNAVPARLAEMCVRAVS